MVTVPICIRPRVIDSGSNANGYYRKWSDGFADCWVNMDLPISKNASTGIYTVKLNDIWTYPIPFVVNPTLTLTTQSSQDYVYCSPYGVSRNQQKVNSISFLRNGPITGDNVVSVGMIVRGRWK